MNLLLFLSGLLVLSAVLAEFCSWQYETFYDCDFTYGRVIESLHTTRSVMECSGRCNENDECMSVKFDTISKTCQLNTKRILKTLCALGCLRTFRYAVLTTSPCRKVTKKPCGLTTDCSVPNSLCEENRCQCNYGYIYNPGNDNCVETCDVYGSTFTSHVRHGIEGKYNISKEVFPEKECMKACLEETTFVCRTANYDTVAFKCMLSTDISLDAPSRDHNDYLYFTYHRNCQ